MRGHCLTCRGFISSPPTGAGNKVWSAPESAFKLRLICDDDVMKMQSAAVVSLFPDLSSPTSELREQSR